MDKKTARKNLVAALRSGNYNQTKSTLRRENSFCCLGVACDLIKDEWVEAEQGFFLFDGEQSALPKWIMEKYGFKDRAGDFIIRDNEYHVTYCLAELNDEGLTFDQIADIIEYEPEGLFE